MRLRNKIRSSPPTTTTPPLDTHHDVGYLSLEELERADKREYSENTDIDRHVNCAGERGVQ